MGVYNRKNFNKNELVRLFAYKVYDYPTLKVELFSDKDIIIVNQYSSVSALSTVILGVDFKSVVINGETSIDAESLVGFSIEKDYIEIETDTEKLTFRKE